MNNKAAFNRFFLKIKKHSGKYILAVIVSALMLWPLFWMLSTSLKKFSDVFIFPPQLWPSTLAWQNYVDLFSQQPFLLYMWNSFYTAAAVTAGTVIFSAIAGYAFAKIRFRGRELMFLIILSGMMMPVEITSIPLFIAFSKIGLVNSHFPLIIPQIFGYGGAFGVFIMRQFFITVPHEIDEAAKIDGCTPWKTFWVIMFPMAKSSIATLCIFTFINNINEIFLPLIYLSSSRLYTITLAIATFTTEMGVQWHLIMAAATVSTLPSLIVFFIGQKKFMASLSMSGLK